MRLGYNTNGLGDHRAQEAIALIAERGYQSIAITVDHHCLDPYNKEFSRNLEEYQRLLRKYRLTCVIETGARFLLDPRHKHEPTLISGTLDERARRIDFLKRCVDIAHELEADAVSFWAGILRQPWSFEEAFGILREGLLEVLQYASTYGVKIAFEPEPGMLIETMEQFRRLHEAISHPLFGLTIDIGHLQCVEPRPIPEILREWGPRLFNLHIEDMKRNLHEHLMFGEGEIDFVSVMKTLLDLPYEGGVHVELSRHSHQGPEMVKKSYDFLSSAIEEARGQG